MLYLRRTFIALLVLYWALLITLTHLPALPAGGPKVGDKTAHMIAYALLSASIYATWTVCNPRRRYLGWIVLGVAMAYGVIDEVTQPFVGRICELADWLADSAGAAIGVVVMMGVRKGVERWVRRPAAEWFDAPAVDAPPA